MKKFLSRFSPLLLSLIIGDLIVFFIGEVLIVCVAGFLFREYLAVTMLGFALGILITLVRLTHMHWTTMGTIFNEESSYIQFFSWKSYAVRNAITMAAWVCIFYFLGQVCMLAAIIGTIISSKVAVFTQPITDKLFITKIFK